jgi:hypothetical protein
LVVLPVINKIDMMSANVDVVEFSMVDLFGFDECIKVSAKTGLNVDSLLEHIVTKIPPPPLVDDGVFKGNLYHFIQGSLSTAGTSRTRVLCFSCRSNQVLCGRVIPLYPVDLTLAMRSLK